MEPLRIYSKTAQGAAALNAARGAVSSSARQLLILIDGRRDVGELRGIFGEETVSRLLPQLEAQGYVKRVRDSTRTPPPTISPVQHAPVPPRNGIAVSGPSAGPPGNFLAKAALASGVILVSGTIWWFLGGSGVPGIAPAPDASNAPPNAATTPDTIAAVSAAPVLVAGTPGAAWAPGGHPRAVWSFKVEHGRIVEMQFVGDPALISRLDVLLLD